MISSTVRGKKILFFQLALLIYIPQIYHGIRGEEYTCGKFVISWGTIFFQLTIELDKGEGWKIRFKVR